MYPSISGVVKAAIQSFTSASGTQYAQSIYVKASGKNFAALYALNGNAGPAMWVNLTTGAITNGSTPNVVGRFATSVGDGWWRIGFADLGNGTIGYMHIYPTDTAGSQNVTANGTDGILIWGGQLNYGSVAQEYIKTTTAAVYRGITDNTPRLDYTDSSCPALLLEPQRTNLLENSEYILGGDWNQLGGALSIAQNTTDTLSPEGKYNAGAITLSSTANRYFSSQGYNLGGLTAVSASVWLKTNGGELQGALAFFNGTGGDAITITEEWQRFEINKTASNSTEYLGLDFRGSYSQSGIVYCYGWQFENNASYATSYIPTYGSSVSRIKEICEVTSAEDLIGQTEGTIAGEFNYDSGEPTNRLFSITGGDWNTIGSIRFDIISLKPQATIRANGGEPAKIIGTQDINVGTLVKFAVVYTSTTLKMFVNGSQIGSTATLSGSLPSTLDEIRINALGGNFVSDTQNNQLNPYKQALVFKTALTDQEAIDLTTI